MKRVFTISLVVVMLASVLTAGSMAYAHAAVQVAGDVNGDGLVNNRDLGLLQQLLNGFGITILSTNKGVLSDREARESNVGGEVICEVW